MQLRPYQNELVEQVRKAWRDGFKAPCIVLGCGGGKSCIVAEIARRTTWNGGSTNIFFIRKKADPDTPYYTIEVGTDCDIIQCRGYRNDRKTSKPEEVKAFEKEYKRYLEELKNAGERENRIKLKSA